MRLARTAILTLSSLVSAIVNTKAGTYRETRGILFVPSILCMLLHGFQERSNKLCMGSSEAQVQEMIKRRDTDIILFSMKIGEALALLAAAKLFDFCIGLETMIKVVRIVGGWYSRCGWALCVRICGVA